MFRLFGVAAVVVALAAQYDEAFAYVCNNNHYVNVSGPTRDFPFRMRCSMSSSALTRSCILMTGSRRSPTGHACFGHKAE